ncbi:lipoprotein-releasing ABC transporter permease subunit [Henriciella sp.]|uniref:lipoprotein-releasing ABC transporter permease subunit n=1 Tax=Henriciella sp. TaxID=1968823 RepID=UPI00261155E8|nr:lipoprotein-releasing ABC transporter permease subunit [Henriciella sp.]
MAKSAPFGGVERALAWRYLRARRAHGGVSLISIISFFGIMLAVMALIVIMSVMAGFRSTLLNALLGGQGHVFVQVEDYPAGDVDELAKRIIELPDIKSASPIIEQQVLATSDYARTGALVRGIRPQDMDKLPYLEGGLGEAEAVGWGEGKNGGDVVMIGAFLASDLRIRPGDEIRLIAPEGVSGPFGVTPRSKTYTVGGTFTTGSVELDKLYVLMPMQQAQLFFNRKGQYQLVDVRVEDPMRSELAMRHINEATNGQYYLQDWKQQRASYFNALNVERGMMRVIMLILITITALNIITGVVMLVKNKTRDIAILRTIGATRGAIMRIFIMIGAILGLTGALIGLGLGVLIVLNIDAVEAALSLIMGREIFAADVYGLDGLPAELDWGEALFTTLWAMSMSILVTIWPAWNAARLDPVDALRFE